jgi:hypothetical protein
MKNTISALMAREFDSARAKEIASSGWTLSALKATTAAKLRSEGFSDLEIAILHKGQRPPIPKPTLTRLLFNNRFQCCVCRDAEKPIIVHHITEWAKSRSHDISNLAVVCLPHHAKAHSKGTLDQNLDPETLRTMKLNWEAEVPKLDARSIIAALQGEYKHWAFINELRVLELAGEHGIQLNNLHYYRRAVADGILDDDGLPLPVDESKFYKYEGSAILTRYGLMKELLERVIAVLPIDNLSDYFDRDVVMPILTAGDFIFVQGAHVFSPLRKGVEGMGQHCRGARTANKVEVRFVFDRWEATSSSSLNDWLVGTKSVGSLLHVKNIQREDGKVIVTGTALAIAAFTNELKTRDYCPRWGAYFPYEDDEEEDNGLEDFWDDENAHDQAAL